MNDHFKIPSALWEGMQRVGLARHQVLAHAKLSLRLVQDDAPISTAQFFALWRAMVVVSGDPHIGLWIATELDGGVMPPSFLAAYHARDYRDALQRVARFKRLCAPEEIRIEEHADHASVQLHWLHAEEAELPPALVEASLASLMELGRSGTSAPLHPVFVSLTRPSEDPVVLERYFGCPVQFGAAHNGMTLRVADLAKPFVQYNSELLQILDQALQTQVDAQAHRATLSEQIRWILRRRLTAGRPDIRSIASELAMSERSLQRRLTEEGVRFQDLLSQSRHQLALEYLRDRQFSLIEVAFMLGYEDQNSFFRAFRQWEFRTPSEWRADHKADSGVNT
ncbi:AraC family transcriptional regulator [Polaromonas jejuensis]|uniref:AraC family transcriptional regulator ligand-binding domain-containing protein n=1 Tax=Polaromonas jejuensis TaxID=457502 RepID=A0ABW0Q6Y0_9BURK|nr:AraC family transcriptional regulator [Polaromonas jejuensis]